MRRLTFLLGASMILLGALFIALGAWYFEKEGAKQFLFEIGIAALSAGMVGLVYASVVRSDFLDQVKGQLEKILNADAPRLGIKHIYETRTTKNDDVKLPHLIDQARSEIMFVAFRPTHCHTFASAPAYQSDCKKCQDSIPYIQCRKPQCQNPRPNAW
jgi:hypothetical protein